MITWALLIAGAVGQVAPYAPLVPLDAFGWGSTSKEALLQTINFLPTSSGNYTLYTAENTAAPTPTMVCVPSGYNATTGAWTCSGGFTANPIQNVPDTRYSPFYRSGWDAGPDVVPFFRQSTTTSTGLSFGDVLDQDGSFSFCWVALAHGTTGYVMAKSSQTAANSTFWAGYSSGQIAQFRVYNSGGSYSSISATTNTEAPEWESAVCGAYEAAGAGSSKMRIYWAAGAGTEITNAVAAQTNSPAAFTLGQNSDTTNAATRLLGSIDSVYFWSGTAFSNTQLKYLHDSLIGLVPGGKALSFTRTSRAICEPTGPTGPLTRLGRNFPCWTSSGLVTHPAYTNLATGESDISAWAVVNHGGVAVPTITLKTYISPDYFTKTTADTASAARIAIPATPDEDDTSFVLNSFTSAAGPLTISAWVRSDTGTATVRMFHGSTDGTCDNYQPIDCPATTTWSLCSFTVTAVTGSRLIGIGTKRECGGTDLGQQTFGFWGLQYTPTATRLPKIISLNTAYSATATTITTGTSSLDFTKPYVVSARYKPAQWVSAGDATAYSAFTVGNTAGAENGIAVTHTPSTGISATLTDSAAHRITVGGAPTPTEGASACLAVAHDGASAVKLYVDNVEFGTESLNEGHAGFTPAPSAIYLGGTASENGWYRQINVCQASKPNLCCP